MGAVRQLGAVTADKSDNAATSVFIFLQRCRRGALAAQGIARPTRTEGQDRSPVLLGNAAEPGEDPPRFDRASGTGKGTGEWGPVASRARGSMRRPVSYELGGED